MRKEAPRLEDESPLGAQIPGERMFRVLLDGLSTAAYACDSDGLITYFNQKAALLWGRRPLLKDPKDRFCGSLRLYDADGSPLPHDQSCVARALRTDGDSPSREIVIERPDGSRAVALTHAGLLRDEDGRLLGAINVLVDITERKLAEDALRASEVQHRSIFVNAVEGIFQTTPAGTFLNVNPALARMYGLSSPEEVIAHFKDIGQQLYVDPGRRREFHRLIELQDAVTGFEFQIQRIDGSYAWVSSSTRAVRDAAGKLLYYEGTVEDITERKRAEEALRTSEERFRLLAENAADIIYRYEFIPQRRFAYVSPAAKLVVGYTPEEHYADPDLGFKIVHPEDRPLLKSFSDSEAPWPRRLVLRWQHRDGRIIWTENRLVPVFDDAGKLTAVEGVACDITDRVQAEIALRESQEMFEAFMRNSPAIAFIKSEDDRLLYVNKAFEEQIWDGRPPDWRNRTGEELWPPDMARQLRENDLRILASGRPEVVEESVDKKQVKEAWLSFKFPFVRASGERCLAGMAVNVTERKQAEEERRRLEAQIQHAQKLESLGVLAGGIAHDFNNLLTSMLGYAEMALTRMSDDSIASPMIREVVKAAERAAELTQQMLAYSGRGKFVVEAFRLDSLVREMAKLLKTVVSKKAVLNLDLKPAVIEGDPTQIRQIFINLITNASDALEGHCGVIDIRTGVLQADESFFRESKFAGELPAGDYAFVEVEDSGCGMTEETLGKIFDPFFSTKFTGRGLGLAAVLGIVRGHGGAVKVKSAIGRGAIFQVYFPCSSAAVRHVEPSSHAAATPAAKGAVLVIEDEEIVRTYVRRVLDAAGFQVLGASDGREGLDLLTTQGKGIALVLLDLTMPRLDGLEVLQEMRKILPDVPVLLTSGYSEAEVSRRCAGFGASGFLQKPFTPSELLSRVSHLMKGRVDLDSSIAAAEKESL